MLMPCQQQWLTNKMIDLYGGAWWFAPCTLHTNAQIVIHEMADDLPEGYLIQRILAGCAQHCPFACDSERILRDRSLCKCSEASDRVWKDYSP